MNSELKPNASLSPNKKSPAKQGKKVVSKPSKSLTQPTRSSQMRLSAL